MQNVGVYRRRVQFYEWKHATLQMKIDDLKMFIKTIEKCVVNIVKKANEQIVLLKFEFLYPTF